MTPMPAGIPDRKAFIGYWLDKVIVIGGRFDVCDQIFTSTTEAVKWCDERKIEIVNRQAAESAIEFETRETALARAEGPETAPGEGTGKGRIEP